MAKVNGSFKIDIPKTADLVPPTLECDWEAEFDGDKEIETVLLGYFKKNYGEGLKKVMSAQTAKISEPLSSMQKEIDGMRKLVEYIGNETNPVKYFDAIEVFKKKYPKPLNEMVDEANKHLADIVKNIKDQQVEIYRAKFEKEALEAAKKAVKRDVSNKKFRHIAGVVLKGVIVLAVAAAAIAAIVLTFGTAGVAFAAIAAASAGLGGVSALVKTGKLVYDIRDLEKRSLDLLVKDVTAVTSKLDGVEQQLTGISKHVADVSMLYTKRKEKTVELAKEIGVAEKAVDDVQKEIDKLRSSAPKIHKEQGAKLIKAKESLTKAKEAYVASTKRDQELEQALNSAKAAIGDLTKIPFQAAKGKLDGITRIDFKSADTYVALMDNLTSLSGSVGGIGMAKTAK